MTVYISVSRYFNRLSQYVQFASFHPLSSCSHIARTTSGLPAFVSKVHRQVGRGRVMAERGNAKVCSPLSMIALSRVDTEIDFE